MTRRPRLGASSPFARALAVAVASTLASACVTDRAASGASEGRAAPVPEPQRQASPAEAHEGPSLSSEPIDPRTTGVPDRPRPLLELGDPFLGVGPFAQPKHLFTGATIQPAFLVYGTFRTAVQGFDTGNGFAEWASRLDLFGNLQLSGTERVLVGLRPLDEDGRFTRYVFDEGAGNTEEGWSDEFNGEVSTLFFEGDFGEIFPGLDPTDGGRYDVGFSVGRQPISFQDGLLIDDRVDAFGITRNTLLPGGASNLRVTGLVAWNEIDRGGTEDDDVLLFGLFSEADFAASTISLDGIWVEDQEGDTSSLHAGAGAVQRIGHTNTTVRVVTSHPSDGDSARASRGTLAFAEASRNPTASDDLVYLNGFYGWDRYTSAARSPENGGPLGRTGILFAAVGLGSYGAPLDNSGQNAWGGALGWQTFLGDEDHRHQLVLEVGGLSQTEGLGARDFVASGFQYQSAVGRHAILSFGGFYTGRDGLHPVAGVRTELQLKF